MKKQLAIEQANADKVRRGEISDYEKQRLTDTAVVAIANPENTKKKVPIRLHEKVRETSDPVVGLDFVTEVIAASDPEMEPHYECELCGSKGIANGMFTHIMGYKHRQAFIIEYHKDDPRDVLEQSQRQLLDFARRHAENEMDLTTKIRSRRSDDDYPWPVGKAPWSKEQGGSGIPPDRARENVGLNNECRDMKPNIERIRIDSRRDDGGFGRGRSSKREGGLPAPSSVQQPKNDDEAIKMISLAKKLLEVGAGYVGPKLSNHESTLLSLTTQSMISKILTKRRISLPQPSSSNSNGQSSRLQNSKSPSPHSSRNKRER